MDDDLRVTVPVARVLRMFLEDVTAPQYGFDLMDATGLASGSLYPILVRLERAGWITGAKEDIDPRAAGRPPRRYFKLTGTGEQVARRRLAELTQEFTAPVGMPQCRPGMQGGFA
jgi:PadR family transcriptional regulator PadR